MQATKSLTTIAASLADELLDHGFSPFYGTPCGILAPLYAALEDKSDLLTVPREDTAIGVAAGAAAAGHLPVVLMQNSGLGQSVNALRVPRRAVPVPHAAHREPTRRRPRPDTGKHRHHAAPGPSPAGELLRQYVADGWECYGTDGSHCASTAWKPGAIWAGSRPASRLTAP